MDRRAGPRTLPSWGIGGGKLAGGRICSPNEPTPSAREPIDTILGHLQTQRPLSPAPRFTLEPAITGAHGAAGEEVIHILS